MKRFLILTSVLILLCGTLFAGEVTIDYSFDRPDISQVRIGGTDYDRITMNNAPTGGYVGHPALPSRGARILLPMGTEVASVHIITGEKVFLGKDYFVEPVSRPVKLSADPGIIVYPEPDEAIYGANGPYPGARFENIRTQNFRGYDILFLKLNPMEFIPATGELYYYPDMQVIVTTTAANKELSMFRGLADDDAEVRAKVDNPEAADTFLGAMKSGMRAYSMMIITPAEFAPSFQPLIDYHDSTGAPCMLYTVEEIGATTADDFRNFISARYGKDGFNYVLLGGDDDIIPSPNLYVDSDPNGGGEVETDMPGDLFFGCLNGTWNYDGDSYWGEPTDGTGGGDVDLVAEVYCGRASVGSVAEADRFVSKTIQYLSTTPSTLPKVLLVGEHLGFGGDSEYAGNTMEELEDGSDAHGYTTVGIPTGEFDIDELFERDWPGNDWPQSELTSRINDGLHIVNHLGHGSPDYAMKLYNPDVMSTLTNTDHIFVYSQTCLAGHFDGTDCWAETITIKTDYGAFAVVMNARYGWGDYNTTDGPSQRFNREFWDAVYNPAENMREIGRANQDSKEDNLYRLDEECMRWCYYELNVFGDPMVAIKSADGIAFNYPDGLPELLSPGTDTMITVNVVATGNGVPVSGTGQMHYSINDAPFVTVNMTEGLPHEYTVMLPAVGCDESLRYYFSAEEATLGRIADVNPENAHSPIIATAVINAFEDDFESDLGWVISGGSWNRGTPTGGGGEYGEPDPSSAYGGSNVLGYNLNGDYTNSMPEYHVTSPTIDCSGLSGAHLSFWRWLGVEQPSYDHAYIRISTNGSAWTTVWENSGTISDEEWTQIDLDISAYADGQPTVYIRFTMGTTDSGWRYCGWNIDDLSVYGYVCDFAPLAIATPSLPDWTAGFEYSRQLQATGGVGVKTWVDKNNDLVGSGLSLSTDGIITGIPSASGPVSFTAEVTDEDFTTVEKPFAFTINPAIAIMTEELPPATIGEEYSHQMTCTGGTGDHIWSDMHGDLNGSGLSLSETGLISGTPLIVSRFDLTICVTDNVGCAADKPMSLIINPDYMCGDANSDEVINVADAVFIVNYVFKGGAAPDPLAAADANSDGDANLADCVFIINYVFKGGEAPACP